MSGAGRDTVPLPYGDPSLAKARITPANGVVVVGEASVTRLRAACATVDVDDRSRADAGRDWWPLALTWATGGEVPALPAVVARPTTAAEVAAVISVCVEDRLPLTPFAGRSGVCGASVPVFGGVSLDLCGLDGIVAVDDDSLLVDVRAGMFGDAFEDELRSKHRLTIGHWPQSIALSTVGGWAACRGAGQYSTRYGKIEDMVVGLEVVLASGEIIRTGGRGPRAASGPDLTQLLLGSEGTLGVITEVRLRAHPVPPTSARAAYGFLPGDGGAGSFVRGLEACRRILRRGATPAVLRLYDERESKRSYDVEGQSVLIVLDEAEQALVEATLEIVEEECEPGDGSVIRLDDALVERWLGHRNDVSGLADTIGKGLVVDTSEISARWSALPGIYDAVNAAMQTIPGHLVVSAHQSHAYTDGACLYFTFAGLGGSDADPSAGDRYYRAAWDAVTRTTLAHGGTLSHHHGVGLNRSRYMEEAVGAGTLAALRAVKAALDPSGILNPGKLGFPHPFGPVEVP